MTFIAIADDLRRTVNDAQGALQSLSEKDTSERPQPGKWSKKEILGHLIDSATNNHQRFVRAQETEAGYNEQTDIRYAAARLWVDGILDPVRTRETLLLALEVATRYDDGREFRTGVLQV